MQDRGYKLQPKTEPTFVMAAPVLKIYIIHTDGKI